MIKKTGEKEQKIKWKMIEEEMRGTRVLSLRCFVS
ncbi:MAG: hypothetical protein UT31_C0025G0006, partial [Parcubacteria group bacterium GW2011_GWF2_39_13b]